MKAVFTNSAYNYANDAAEANATLSADGSITFFAKPLVEVKQIFLTVVIKFSNDGSENFDIDFMNKTINLCKMFYNPRYEPLIQLVVKIISVKVRLPQRCPVRKVFNKNY